MTAAIPGSPAPPEDQAKLLDEVLHVVKIQAHQMRKCLENNKLMDGLKHCSNMLSELRTSQLTPKNYYELYMAIFDAMRHLTIYLRDAHNAERHHLADLYELVQYAGNIVPRLYLMVTVGSVYMGTKDAPVREIMRDMMEMARGVQHPTRGLFLRHYLSGMTRDYLPDGEGSGPEGNVHESVHFILTNFTEMNKLWVRLQHQGHTRDREKREAERRELRILVGTNLVRLSQLEGVDLRIYQNLILPGILDQVVSCRDMIAQEYLMEVIIQVFPDEFHLRTLQPFLSATAQLHPRVNIKHIIIALIDRLAAFAARESEADTSLEKRRQKEDEARLLQVAKKRNQPLDTTGDHPSLDDEHGDGEPSSVDGGASEGQTEEEGCIIKGIPQDVELFVVFWAQIVELVKARPDLSIQDLTALLVSLTKLSLSCYPSRLQYVDQILAYAKDKVIELADSADLHSKVTEANLLALLLAPINSYTSVLTLLALSNYHSLLTLRPYNTRRAVAHAIVSSILKNETTVSAPEDVHDILELCEVLLRDQKDMPTGAVPASPIYPGVVRGRIGMEQEDLAEEQGWMARLVHLFVSENDDTQFLLLSAARKQFSEGGGRIRYTFPPMIVSAMKLARRYKQQENQDEIWEKKTSALFRFIDQTISTLHEKCDNSNSDQCLRFYLLAAQSADECGFDDIAYEMFVQAFTVYEESISESRAQFQAITCIIGALNQASVFSADMYDTLITKAALHSAKLLKKPDQCRAVTLSSHLWWSDTNKDSETASSDRNSKRALECLQKALKIADSVMDLVTNVQLFVEVLNRCIFYFEKGNEEITPKYLNSLIDLIHANLGNMDNPDQHPPTSTSSTLYMPDGPIPDYVRKHFAATLQHIKERKALADDQGVPYAQVDVGTN
ncbi:vacuolar protein sorting-associated protein 35 [Dichotomocladium elegans]|nr:vacuolar protein sorting-associated protein 35 [Dichotomocladium elegans]